MQNITPNQHWKVLVLMLKEIAQQKGKSIQSIADDIGMKQPNLSRIFNLKHAPSIKIIGLIAHSIGVMVTFQDKDSKTDLAQAVKNVANHLTGLPPESLN